MEQREVARCIHCHLNQFPTERRHCRRCHKALPSNKSFQVPETPDPLAPLTSREVVQLVGTRIRAMRKSYGMTVQQLGDSSHMSRSNVSKIENGQTDPTLLTLEKLAIALHTEEAKLFVASKTGELLFNDPFMYELLPILATIPRPRWGICMSHIVTTIAERRAA
jgi:transcriptional regulator with XRE-family HTH domain